MRVSEVPKIIPPQKSNNRQFLSRCLGIARRYYAKTLRIGDGLEVVS